jgi:hypothetical protein
VHVWIKDACTCVDLGMHVCVRESGRAWVNVLIGDARVCACTGMCVRNCGLRTLCSVVWALTRLVRYVCFGHVCLVTMYGSSIQISGYVWIEHPCIQVCMHQACVCSHMYGWTCMRIFLVWACICESGIRVFGKMYPLGMCVMYGLGIVHMNELGMFVCDLYGFGLRIYGLYGILWCVLRAYPLLESWWTSCVYM